MEKRTLGNTGLGLSVLGFGGFHLVEITQAEAGRLLGAYLDRGGNYIETAASYGDGNSERKIGASVSGRRTEFILATKTTQRTGDGCTAELERSLRNLRTDHVDVLFMHAILTAAEADRALAPGGSVEAAQAAQKAGKVRFIGITGHGRPDGLLYAIPRHPFSVMMTQFNYLDRFNFPAVEAELLPQCRDKGVGVLAMKSLGDGYLHRSLRPALRYVLSLPIASVVMGMNSMDMLERDFEEANAFKPMTGREAEKLYAEAPELGDYVCRFCAKCTEESFDPQRVFALEALFDRQMDDMRVPDSGGYALRERLKSWFGQTELAVEEYAALAPKVDPQKDYTRLNRRCPYGIDIDRKLKITHMKLSRTGFIA
jgi:predicted aldo/keto reductase-like oxidoreductase